jgi:transcription elongation factor GreA
MTASRRAADLLRDIGLLADGPVRWGKPVPGRGSGIYLVELAVPLAAAPIELTKVGKWLERLPLLRLDGERPTSKALAARLAAFWLPEALLVYAGATTASVGGRAESLARHVLGDRRPHADGQWLHALRGNDQLRIWWAGTNAPEEALDAVFDAFGERHSAALPGRPAGALTLPWANTRRPTGERQPHGITGAVEPEAPTIAPPPTRRIDLPPGDADGVPTAIKGTGTTRRTGRPPATGPAMVRSGAPPASATRTPRSPGGGSGSAARFEQKRDAIPMTADAIERAKVELDELTRLRRPEIVARIKSARELGDLKENAEYHAAREEQSFLEGRVRMLEDRLRYAVVIDESGGDGRTGRVTLGSVVRVEVAGDEMTWTIVGTTEANPAAGRISTSSPVGAALLGAKVGDEVEVRTPRGPARYRITEIS